MSRKARDKKLLARLVTSEDERAPCAFCLRKLDDEITFGQIYAIGDIQCHYFCCLLSCCLIQKGQDDEGLFGFMYSDILAELERCKKHKCSYCNNYGANMGCSVGACRKQFHLPCGREKQAVSMYYGNYKSFCQQHAPRQVIPEHINVKAKLRKRNNKYGGNGHNKANTLCVKNDNVEECTEEMVCVICYESVEGYPTVNTFWPPCCARDAWFHRTCLQRMALSAGMHYLKCPLCNDKETFYEEVVSQGYYVPDRDAAWELEQNAFAEIYERSISCGWDVCLCPMGREHDSETGQWEIKLCLLCGSAGIHAQCLLEQANPIKRSTNSITPSKNPTTPSKNPITSSNNPITPPNNPINPSSNPITPPNNPINPSNNPITPPNNPINPPNNPITPSNNPITPSNNPNSPSQRWEDLSSKYYVCKCCMPAAPEDLEDLAKNIEAIIQREQATNVASSRRPLMPSRMSLRATKRRPEAIPSTSTQAITEKDSLELTNTETSRLELNLKAPKRPTHQETSTKSVDNKMLSPFKLLEQSFKEKVVCMGVRDAVLDESVIEKLRKKFRKPRPFSEKKKIVNAILDGLFNDLLKMSKEKEQIREWRSPKKCYQDKCEIPEINENKSLEDIKNLNETAIKSEDIDSESNGTVNEINEVSNDTINATNTESNVIKEENCDSTLIELPQNNNEVQRNTVDSKRNDISIDIADNEVNANLIVNESDAVLKELIKSNETAAEKDDYQINEQNICLNSENRGIDGPLEKSGKDSFKDHSVKIDPIVLESLIIDTPKRKRKDKIVDLNTDEENSGPIFDKERDFKCDDHSEKIDPFVIENLIIDTPKRKTIDTLQDSSLEITGNDQSISIDVIKREENTKNAYKKLKIILPEKSETCAFKFSPIDKEKLEINETGIDLESFKKEYLNEVGRDKCEKKPTKKHKKVKSRVRFADDLIIKDFNTNNELEAKNVEHMKTEEELINIQEPINRGHDKTKKKKVKNPQKVREKTDKEVEIPSPEADKNVTKHSNDEEIIKKAKSRKRKSSNDSVHLVYGDYMKRRKISDLKEKTSETKNIEDRQKTRDSKHSIRNVIKKEETRKKLKKRERDRTKKRKLKKSKKDIKVSIDSTENITRKNKTIKKKIRIQNADIQVRIQWKKEQLSLDIESKRKINKIKKENRSKYKQYILNFPEGHSKEVIAKPEKEVKLKRKYHRQEKSPDKLKQTSIASFFKTKVADENGKAD